MLTVAQIVQYTKIYHKKVLQNARKVVVKVVSITKGKDKEKDEFRRLEILCRGDTIPRYVTLMFWGPFNENAMMWSSCTCEYFKYHCEVALDKQGSSDIKHSNGKLPKEKNPNMVPVICKHIAGALMSGAHTMKPPSKIEKIIRKIKGK